MIYNFRWNNIS